MKAPSFLKPVMQIISSSGNGKQKILYSYSWQQQCRMIHLLAKLGGIVQFQIDSSSGSRFSQPIIKNALVVSSLQIFCTILQFIIFEQMPLREPIIKLNDLKFKLSIQKMWQAIQEYSPAILKTPLVLLDLVLKIINRLLIIVLLLVLLGQTIHILNGSQRRYINLRHLLIKWISLVVVIALAESVKKHTNYDEMFELMCNLSAMGMVYPSKFIKNLHLKYFSFSQRKKYEQSMDDVSELDMSLATRMLSSIVIFLLNVCRFTITFIAPQHRKRIQEAMRGVNLVIVEQKYFWKMYETNAKGSVVIPSNSSNLAQLQRTGSLTKSGFINRADMVVPKSPTSAYPAKDNILRAKIPVTSSGSINEKVLKDYRDISIVYACESGQLTVIGEQDGKSTTHMLTEFSEENNLMLKFGFENEDEPLFVQFRNKKEYEMFYNTLYIEAQNQDR